MAETEPAASKTEASESEANESGASETSTSEIGTSETSASETSTNDTGPSKTNTDEPGAGTPKKAAPERRGGTSWGAGKKARPRRAGPKKDAPPRSEVSRTYMYAEEAAHWFVGDLLEVSGFVRPHMRHRSGYSHYRPVLTKPDPWYFAGLVALEACKIMDLFPPEKADALLREVLAQADAAGKRHDVRVSHLVQGVMGRLGMGALLLKAPVPDILISKVMRLLLGSPKAAIRLVPTREAHEQVTSALKLGQPVWWKMFVRRYNVRLKGEAIPARKPKLIPIAPAPDAPVPEVPALEVPALDGSAPDGSALERPAQEGPAPDAPVAASAAA